MVNNQEVELDVVASILKPTQFGVGIGVDIQDIMPDNCAKVDKVLVEGALGCAISGWWP